MDDVKDQVQADSPAETPTGAPVITKDQANKEQSETTKVEPELYELPDGRKVDPSTLSKEWKDNFYPEFTKKSQRLAQLEKERQEWEQKAQVEAAKAVSSNDYLKDVDPNVREAIVQIVTPVIQDSLRQRDAEAQRRAQNEAFTSKLNELKNKYPGGNGLPKFDEVKVLAAMRDPTNSIFDPEWKFKEMNYAAIMDYELKQAIKGKSGGVETETTGSSQPRKPESSKAPKSWADASRAALGRLSEQ